MQTVARQSVDDCTQRLWQKLPAMLAETQHSGTRDGANTETERRENAISKKGIEK